MTPGTEVTFEFEPFAVGLLVGISEIVTESVLYGLYLVIFAIGIRVLMKRPARTKYTWVLFGFLSGLFLLSTVELALQVAATVQLLKANWINFSVELHGYDTVPQLDIYVAQVWLGGSPTSGFLYILADAVVVWRACVLWPGSKIAKVVLLALLFISFGLVTYSAVVTTISLLDPTATLSEAVLSPEILLISLGLSVLTNVVATFLIGYKAYHYRRLMKATMGVQNSRAGAILLFLTESGVVFCILQVIMFATFLLSTALYVGSVMQQITFFAAAAYPVLVLIVVDNHRSISDYTSGSLGDSGVVQ